MSSLSPADHAERPGAAGPRDEPSVEAGPDKTGAGRGGRAILVLLAVAGLLIAGGGAWLWALRGQTVFVDMLASALAMCF
jgi:hypothetical protein